MDVASERATLDFGMAKEDDSLDAMPGLLSAVVLALESPSNQLFLAVPLCSPPTSGVEVSATPAMRPVVFLDAPIEMPVMITLFLLFCNVVATIVELNLGSARWTLVK